MVSHNLYTKQFGFEFLSVKRTELLFSPYFNVRAINLLHRVLSTILAALTTMASHKENAFDHFETTKLKIFCSSTFH